MDDIVKQAMAKWPNVPHCYAWLALDARGVFRMRDETAQKNNSAGDPIRHTALLAFVHRNYTSDASGAWFFQNGPQRVYVDLEATPYVVRTDPAVGFVLHDGQPLALLEHVYLTDEGQLILKDATHVAMLDDRDMAHCLPQLHWNGNAVEDAQLLAWLAAPDAQLRFLYGGKAIPVQAIRRADLTARLSFIALPRQ